MVWVSGCYKCNSSKTNWDVSELFSTLDPRQKDSLSFCRGSGVEGSMSRARVPRRGSKVTFFFPKFLEIFGWNREKLRDIHKENVMLLLLLLFY